jgi:hypothetical protein
MKPVWQARWTKVLVTAWPDLTNASQTGNRIFVGTQRNASSSRLTSMDTAAVPLRNDRKMDRSQLPTLVHMVDQGRQGKKY